MSESWAALVSVPSKKRERLTAILEPMHTRIEILEWRQLADLTPPDLPRLLVAPIMDFVNLSESVAWLRDVDARPATALLTTALPAMEIYQLQIQHDLLNVIPEEFWNDPPCLERTFRGFLLPETMFDIHCFVTDPIVREEFEIRTLAEKHQIADELVELARPFLEEERQARDIHLITNELINNAFFHAFRDEEGEQKYSPRGFSHLDEGDSILFEVALAKGAIALAVEDNVCSLSPREVLKYLMRQTTGEGAFDSHGRGFYLMTHLVDHLSICLEPGRRARVIVSSHARSGPPAGTINFFVVR